MTGIYLSIMTMTCLDFELKGATNSCEKMLRKKEVVGSERDLTRSTVATQSDHHVCPRVENDRHIKLREISNRKRRAMNSSF